MLLLNSTPIRVQIITQNRINPLRSPTNLSQFGPLPRSSMEFRYRAGEDRPLHHQNLHDREAKKAIIRVQMIAREKEEQRVLEEEVRRELALEREMSFQRLFGEAAAAVGFAYQKKYYEPSLVGHERDLEVRGWERHDRRIVDRRRFLKRNVGFQQEFPVVVDDGFRDLVSGYRNQSPRSMAPPAAAPPEVVLPSYRERELRFRELMPAPEVFSPAYVEPAMRFGELPIAPEVVRQPYVESEPKITDVSVDPGAVPPRPNAETQPRISEVSADTEIKPSMNTLPGIKRKTIAYAAGIERPAPKRFACALCQVTATGKEGLDEHLKGKKHKAQVEKLGKPATSNNASGKRKLVPAVKIEPVKKSKKVATQPTQQPVKPFCHICNVPCNSQAMLDNHLQGKKHAANVAALEKK